MSDEKTRFSARVQTGTLETLDEHAEAENLNRSQTIDRVVEEWQELRGSPEPDGYYYRMSGHLLRYGTLLGSIGAIMVLALTYLPLPYPSALALGAAVGYIGMTMLLVVGPAVLLLQYVAYSLLEEDPPHPLTALRERWFNAR